MDCFAALAMTVSGMRRVTVKGSWYKQPLFEKSGAKTFWNLGHGICRHYTYAPVEKQFLGRLKASVKWVLNWSAKQPANYSVP